MVSFKLFLQDTIKATLSQLHHQQARLLCDPRPGSVDLEALGRAWALLEVSSAVCRGISPSNGRRRGLVTFFAIDRLVKSFSSWHSAIVGRPVEPLPLPMQVVGSKQFPLIWCCSHPYELLNQHHHHGLLAPHGQADAHSVSDMGCLFLSITGYLDKSCV